MDAVQRYGAGPFFLNENIELSRGEHRGKPTDFVHSSAFGQWGNIMVEFTQQVSDTTHSPFRDMFQPGENGLHHVAIMVEDMDESIAHFATEGMPLVTRATTRLGGADFGFVDAIDSLGHMIEIYPKSDSLIAFYDFVRTASENWDGSDPLRKV